MNPPRGDIVLQVMVGPLAPMSSSFSPALISAERGDLQNEFIEITEDEANPLVERIRTTVTGANNG
jgi:hypothetical protein